MDNRFTFFLHIFSVKCFSLIIPPGLGWSEMAENDMICTTVLFVFRLHLNENVKHQNNQEKWALESLLLRHL